MNFNYPAAGSCRLALVINNVSIKGMIVEFLEEAEEELLRLQSGMNPKKLV